MTPQPPSLPHSPKTATLPHFFVAVPNWRVVRHASLPRPEVAAEPPIHTRVKRRQISVNPSVSNRYDGAVMPPARSTNFRILCRIVLERLHDARFFPCVQISCCNLSQIAIVPLLHMKNYSTALSTPPLPLSLVHLLTRRFDQLARHPSEGKAHFGNGVSASTDRDHKI